MGSFLIHKNTYVECIQKYAELAIDCGTFGSFMTQSTIVPVRYAQIQQISYRLGMSSSKRTKKSNVPFWRIYVIEIMKMKTRMGIEWVEDVNIAAIIVHA